jgi:hypothetical protein
MTLSFLVTLDDYGVQQSMAIDPWGDTSQYAPSKEGRTYDEDPPSWWHQLVSTT